MVRVGEETGRLEEMLLKVAETFETDVRTELKRVLGLLEPAIILGMGVLVAFIVVAMLLAIFSINDVSAVKRVRRRLLVDQRGFTLIELLVVIIVLGLLVGLVGPRLFGRVGQSKQAAAKAQIELLGAGLDQYRLDVGALPQHLAGARRAAAESRRAELERPVPEEGGAEGPVGQPVQVPLLPGPARRLRPVVGGRRRRARRRGREHRRRRHGTRRSS